MATPQIPQRDYKTLPKDVSYRAGYDQAYLDISNSVLTYFQQQFMEAPDRPKKGTPEYDSFLAKVGEISRFLKDQRKKATERVKSAN